MRTTGPLLRQYGKFISCLTSTSHFQVQRRWLGQAPSGRQMNNVDASWDEAKKLFYKPSLTYGEFTRRVDAFRMFAFWALVGGISVDLFINPPKSQYWSKWNVLQMPSRLMDKFGAKPSETALSQNAPLGDDHMTDAAREYNRVCNL